MKGKLVRKFKEFFQSFVLKFLELFRFCSPEGKPNQYYVKGTDNYTFLLSSNHISCSCFIKLNVYFRGTLDYTNVSRLPKDGVPCLDENISQMGIAGKVRTVFTDMRKY